MSGVNCITSVEATADVEWRRKGVCCRDGTDDDDAELCREVRSTAGVSPVAA